MTDNHRIYAKTYHGTCWDRPLIPDDDSLNQSMLFDQLSPDNGDLGALYTTDVEGVSEFFATEKHFDDENQVEVMVIGEVVLNNPFLIEFKYGTKVHFNGKEYCVEAAGVEEDPDRLTREHLHEALKEAGYDGMVMEGDYQYMGEPALDIAIFDASGFRPQAVKMKFNGEWTRELNENQARSLFKRWSMAPFMEHESAMSLSC